MRLGPEIDRLGNPLAEGGGLYYVTGIGGLVETSADVSAARVSSQGLLVTEGDLAHFKKQTEKQKRQHLRIIEKLGIPENVRSLISAKNMRDLRRVSANLRLSENDLFLMIRNCRQLGYSCRSKYSTFVPDHLKITDKDLQIFKGELFEQVARRVFNILRERKVINVHLFESNSLWHCFFFTYHDIDEVPDNHWQGGPHVHYVSHLWPRLNPEELWVSLDRRRERASSGMHIKLIPFTWAAGNQIESGSTDDKIFPTNRKLFKAGPPIPLALLSTRGVWIASFGII